MFLKHQGDNTILCPLACHVNYMCVLSLTQHYTFITKQSLWILIRYLKVLPIAKAWISSAGRQKKTGHCWMRQYHKAGGVTARFGKSPCYKRRKQRKTDFWFHQISTRKNPGSILQIRGKVAGDFHTWPAIQPFLRGLELLPIFFLFQPNTCPRSPESTKSGKTFQ